MSHIILLCFVGFFRKRCKSCNCLAARSYLSVNQNLDRDSAKLYYTAVSFGCHVLMHRHPKSLEVYIRLFALKSMKLIKKGRKKNISNKRRNAKERKNMALYRFLQFVVCWKFIVPDASNHSYVRYIKQN